MCETDITPYFVCREFQKYRRCSLFGTEIFIHFKENNRANVIFDIDCVRQENRSVRFRSFSIEPRYAVSLRYDPEQYPLHRRKMLGLTMIYGSARMNCKSLLSSWRILISSSGLLVLCCQFRQTIPRLPFPLQTYLLPV